MAGVIFKINIVHVGGKVDDYCVEKADQCTIGHLVGLLTGSLIKEKASYGTMVVHNPNDVDTKVLEMTNFELDLIAGMDLSSYDSASGVVVERSFDDTTNVLRIKVLTESTVLH